MQEYDEETENESASDDDVDKSHQSSAPEVSPAPKQDDTPLNSTAETNVSAASVTTVDGVEIKQEKMDDDESGQYGGSGSNTAQDASADTDLNTSLAASSDSSPKKSFKTSLFGKNLKRNQLQSKLKVKLPHAAGFKSLKKAKLHAQQQKQQQQQEKTQRGRPTKENAKALARQKLMRQLNAIKTSASDTSKRRGRPPGSKNKVKRISKTSVLASPLRDAEACSDSPRPAGAVVEPMDAIRLPVTPVTKRNGGAAGSASGFRRQSSVQNGHCSSDSAHSPGSAHGSLMSPQQMSPAQLQRRTPDVHARHPFVYSCGPVSPVLSDFEIQAFWRPPVQDRSVLDNVIITDVSSNDTTVTIRECSTAHGFFKNS